MALWLVLAPARSADRGTSRAVGLGPGSFSASFVFVVVRSCCSCAGGRRCCLRLADDLDLRKECTSRRCFVLGS